MHEDHRGKGFGAALCGALFESLGARGIHGLFAGVALPDEPSIALHRALGFRLIGVFEEVGFRFDAWHDVSWWQRRL